MTDVELNELRIALPIKVKMIGDEYHSSIEFPHEYFGLTPLDQVSLIHGVIRAVAPLVEMTQKDNVLDVSKAKDIDELNIALGVVYSKSQGRKVEVTANFGNPWIDMSKTKKVSALNSILLLLQNSAISIVSRESKYGKEVQS